MNGFKAAALEWVRTGVYNQQGGQGMNSAAYRKLLADKEREAQWYEDKAMELWPMMNASQQHGVRFGLFPLEIIEVAKNAGYDQGKITKALMAVAEANGGMRA
jgi:hypothetical protein